MRLFRRKATTIEDESERCPQCAERVPEDADQCLMCGADLRFIRPLSSEGPSEQLPDEISRS